MPSVPCVRRGFHNAAQFFRSAQRRKPPLGNAHLPPNRYDRQYHPRIVPSKMGYPLFVFPSVLCKQRGRRSALPRQKRLPAIPAPTATAQVCRFRGASISSAYFHFFLLFDGKRAKMQECTRNEAKMHRFPCIFAPLHSTFFATFRTDAQIHATLHLAFSLFFC